MTDIESILQSIKERADRATEGPLMFGAESGEGFVYRDQDSNCIPGLCDIYLYDEGSEQGINNLVFFASARSDVPRLAKAVEVLAEEIEKSRVISEAAGCTDNAQFLGSLLQRATEILKGD